MRENLDEEATVNSTAQAIAGSLCVSDDDLKQRKRRGNMNTESRFTEFFVRGSETENAR